MTTSRAIRATEVEMQSLYFKFQRKPKFIAHSYLIYDLFLKRTCKNRMRFSGDDNCF